MGEKTVWMTGTSGPSAATVSRSASTCSAREGESAEAAGSFGQSAWPWIGWLTSTGARRLWLEPL